MEISIEESKAIVGLAADVVTRRLGGDPRPLPPLDFSILSAPAGCFVSLHRRQGHGLRGCIGTIDATRPLRESLTCASETVIADPRFFNQPVTRHELPELEIEITILSPLQKATSPLDFDPAKHGIQLTVGNRSGLFLPQVARDTGWSREQLLARLCKEKLGLPENAWNDPSAELNTFTTDIVGPEPF